MVKQKKQQSQLLIAHGHVDIKKLLTYKTDLAKWPPNENVSKKAKSETPLFYDRPIHKTKKHDLL